MSKTTFKQYLTEKKEQVYKVKDGETGPNRDMRWKKTSSGWMISKDGGDTWKAAEEGHPSPLYNPEDIDIEVKAGSFERVK